MNMSIKRLAVVSALLVMLLPAQLVRAQTATARMVSAANSFLSSLDANQRSRVLFSFADDKQRAHWSNLPNRMVQRAGLGLGELSAAQRSAAMALVAAALSRKGYE